MVDLNLSDIFTNVVLGENRSLIAPLKKAQIISGLDGGDVYVAEEETAEGTKKVVGAAVWFAPGRGMFDTCVSPSAFACKILTCE